jgi:hypothetical protein
MPMRRRGHKGSAKGSAGMNWRTLRPPSRFARLRPQTSATH